jgi:hypothetical protein
MKNAEERKFFGTVKKIFAIAQLTNKEHQQKQSACSRIEQRALGVCIVGGNGSNADYREFFFACFSIRFSLAVFWGSLRVSRFPLSLLPLSPMTKSP